MRIVFRYTGAGPAPAEDLARIKAIDGLHVVDESPRMVLVETDWKQVEAVPGLEAWVLSQETLYEIPEKRPQVKE